MSDVPSGGLNRRDVLKRGAAVGGALVWTVPVVQSLASPAFAAGSSAGDSCSFTLTVTVFDGNGNPTGSTCRKVSSSSSDCCAALIAALNSGINGIRQALGSAACLNVGTETGC